MKPRILKGIEFFKGIDGQFYFKVMAKNGQVLATSEGYTRRWACWQGALAVRRVMRQSE